MTKSLLSTLLFLFLIACKKDVPVNDSNHNQYISAVDISAFPEINNSGTVFYDSVGNEIEMLSFLKSNGINTIRLRLWVNPIDGHSGFHEVRQFSNEIKSQGLKVWLTVHYSDTWADPAHQHTPQQWEGLSYNSLKDSVYSYTKRIVQEMQPHYIQIGNEINSGFLHPQGRMADNQQQFIELLDTAIVAVRNFSPSTQIILHYAGIEGACWFFNQLIMLDFDIIGLSFYPIWHGKSLDSLQSTLQHLNQITGRKTVISETAYPFTLDWNDWTTNIVGSNEQLILPLFPASRTGQREFILQIKNVTRAAPKCLGFCYWGAELVAWKGNQSTDGSPWENQALFDFQNRALPVLEAFNDVE